MKKIKISIAEASQWYADGYAIECYALVEPVKHNEVNSVTKDKIRVPYRRLVGPDTKIGVSMEGTPPTYGHIAEVWAHLKKTLFSDITKVYKRHEITKELAAKGFNKPDARISYLIHKAGVLRVISD